MRRRTFDLLMSAGGLVLTVVLLVAGVLLFVGYNFANTDVEQNLRDQKITFPTADNPQLQDPRIGPYIRKYAGQQLVTGAQAEAYANRFIAVHIADLGKGTPMGGKTYAELGGMERGIQGQIAEAQKNGRDVAALEKNLAEVKGIRDTVFKGETLRGLLLNAYAFWKIGEIARLAGIFAFAAAGLMAVLSVLGFWHLRHVSPTEEFLAPPITLEPRKTA